MLIYTEFFIVRYTVLLCVHRGLLVALAEYPLSLASCVYVHIYRHTHTHTHIYIYIYI